MEKVKKIIKSKYTPYIIILILSIVIMIPLFTMNLSQCNEARIHIGRIVGVKEIISQKIFPSFINSKHMLRIWVCIKHFLWAINNIYTIINIIHNKFINNSIKNIYINNSILIRNNNV